MWSGFEVCLEDLGLCEPVEGLEDCAVLFVVEGQVDVCEAWGDFDGGVA
jgi:hypothetical protein